MKTNGNYIHNYTTIREPCGAAIGTFHKFMYFNNQKRSDQMSEL